MVITILEGEVLQINVSILVNKYKESTKHLPPEIIHTYLVNEVKNPNIWRILTVWKSKKALEDMRKQGTPAGVLMFRSAGVDPTLTIHEVKEKSR